MYAFPLSEKKPMRLLLLSFLLISCAHQAPPVVSAPAWVEAVRTGEGSLKSTHGPKVFYRRIAGDAQFTREVSCGLAVTKAEEDIKKEYPLFPRIPFTVEVMYYDPTLKDCAVTVSVLSDLGSRYGELQAQYRQAVQRRDELEAKEHVTEDEVTEMLQLRAETAQRYALVGLTREEFEKFAKEKVQVQEGEGQCQRFFRTPAYSVHGSTQICWKGEHVVGHCTAADGQCWTKTP